MAAGLSPFLKQLTSNCYKMNRKNGGNWQIPVKHLVENGKMKK